MKIVADENMPFVEELFGSHGKVIRVPGREINADLVADCDVLLVRSVTPVNRDLLAKSSVGFVGSATSGTDHVDDRYLSGSNIPFVHAPGCNANAVVQYMLSVFCACAKNWRQQTVGIVGCGQVGGALYRALKALDVNCQIYDPLLPGQHLNSVDFEQVIASDIICLHVPLTTTGRYPTHHMIDAGVLSRLKPGSILVNAARGAVVDNRALREYLSSGAELSVVLDVWEDEPTIDTALLTQLLLATPHIAGYSADGRRKGTEMVYHGFCQWLQRVSGTPSCRGVTEAEEADRQIPEQECLNVKQGAFEDYVLATFDVVAESRRMVEGLRVCSDHRVGEVGEMEVGEVFDLLRKNSPVRREFSHYRVAVSPNESLAQDLAALGFSVAGLERSDLTIRV